MHDNNVFPHQKEMVKTSKSTKIITNSQQKLHNTTRINFCEPEREIGFARLFKQTNSLCWNTKKHMEW